MLVHWSWDLILVGVFASIDSTKLNQPNRPGGTGLNATKTKVVALFRDCTQSLSSGSISEPVSLRTAEVRRKFRTWVRAELFRTAAVAQGHRLRRDSATK